MNTSKALLAHGTKLFARRTEVAEVKTITIGRHIYVTANWIPEDDGQKLILWAIKNRFPLSFIIQLPLDRGTLQYKHRSVVGQVELLPSRVCILSFSFPAYEGASDPANDGLEVDTIIREQHIADDEEIDRALTNYFRLQSSQELYDQEIFDIFKGAFLKEAVDVFVKDAMRELEWSFQLRTRCERPVGGGFTEVVTPDGPDETGPATHDGHDWEGFPGGCKRFGCPAGCAEPVDRSGPEPY